MGCHLRADYSDRGGGKEGSFWGGVKNKASLEIHLHDGVAGLNLITF